MTTEVLVGRTYIHFKGGVYVVIGIGTSTETLKDMVLYRAADNPNGRIWVRPVTIFLSTAWDGTRTVPRFALVE